MTGTPMHLVEEACPSCGRTGDVVWASKNSRHAVKGKQRADDEDRAAPFRKWRWKFGSPYFASDIDFVEWRIRDGRPTPVALFELTRVDGGAVSPNYRRAILDRFCKRDGQASFITAIGEQLDVPVFIVLFREDCSEFWVYDLSKGKGWWGLDAERMENWIRSIR